MALRGIIERAIFHRSDLNGMGLDTVQVEELVDEVMGDLMRSANVAVVDPVSDREDFAHLVYDGGIVCEAWPLSPLAANGCPTMPVWTSLYSADARAQLVVFDVEDLPRWKRALLRRLERGTDPAR